MIETLPAPRLAEKVDTPYVSLWMDKEGFLCAQYAHNLHLTLEVAVSVVEARVYFAKGRSYPLLIDMRGIKSSTAKAREYMSNIGATLAVAGALITRSALNCTIGNILLAIDQPLVPTRMFTAEAEAKKWLRQFV